MLAIYQMRQEDSRDQLPSRLLSRLAMLASPQASGHSLLVFSLFLFLSLSRLGLWTFDLAVQEIIQTRVPPGASSTFAGTEMAFVSFFELAQWILAAVLARPLQFSWLALISLFAITWAGFMYAYWVRKQRGHLMHFHRIKERCECMNARS